MSTLDWLATLLGIACVGLAARRSIWTFPFGIASVTLVGFVVFEARLYSDALLQAFFVVANIFGWVQWTRARKAASEGPLAGAGQQADEGGRDVPVRHMSWNLRTAALGVVIVSAALWGWTMHRFTDASYPWWDAGIAAASVMAQILMAMRRIENWWLWIAVDLASIPLYLAKGLFLFAGLYLVYLAIAIAGLVSWKAAAPSPATIP